MSVHDCMILYVYSDPGVDRKCFFMQIGNVKNTFYNEIIFENPIFHLLQENYEFVDNLYMYQLHTACLN